MRGWALVLLLPLAVVVLAVWRRRQWLAREAAAVDRLIRTPRLVYSGHDEALQKRTATKREAAAAIRTRAAKVESGSPVGDVLRMVKKA